MDIGDFARLGGVSVRMLRHYDAIGLLVPARIDGRTGRRSYDLSQLGRLNRLVTLKDLGFGLAEVAELLQEPVDEARVRALLEERRAAMAVLLRDTGHRLASVEARLRLVQGGAAVGADVQVKDVPAVRLAGLSAVVAADADDLGGEVAGQFDRVGQLMDAAAVSRLSPVARTAPAGADGTEVTTGYVVLDGAVPGLEPIDLPAARVASVVHRGPMDAVRVGRQELARWAEEQGWTVARIAAAAERTVFLEAAGDDQSEWVVELQLELDPRPVG